VWRHICLGSPLTSCHCSSADEESALCRVSVAVTYVALRRRDCRRRGCPFWLIKLDYFGTWRDSWLLDKIDWCAAVYEQRPVAVVGPTHQCCNRMTLSLSREKATTVHIAAWYWLHWKLKHKVYIQKALQMQRDRATCHKYEMGLSHLKSLAVVERPLRTLKVITIAAIR